MAIHTQVPAVVRFGLPKSMDRAQAFRAALRHSARVRFLRLVLPLLVLTVSGLYLLPTKLTFKTKEGEATIQTVDLTKEGLKMVHPRIRGANEKQGTYDIRAESATQNAKQTEFVTLNTITADLVSLSGQKTTLTAPSGLYQSKKEELTFDKGVVIGGEAGMTGTLKTATAYIQNHVLISADPVDLAYHDSTIKAQAMTVYTNEARVIFTGDVQVHLERAPKESGK